MNDKLRYPFNRLHEELHIPDGDGETRWVYIDAKLTYKDVDCGGYVERRKPTKPHKEVGCLFINLDGVGRRLSNYFYSGDPETRAYADTHLGGRDWPRADEEEEDD